MLDSPQTVSFKGHRFPALDGLRALAILAVIPHNIDVFGTAHSVVDYPAVALIQSGWIGVHLFFVLSGFLITGNLLDSQDSNRYYADFYWRRALRILPLYYAVLLITFVIVPLFAVPPPELQASQHNQIWLWTFLSNWTQPFGGSVHGFSHCWSLAVEEQFYLLWPFLVRRTTPVRLLKIGFGITIAALLVRMVMEALRFPPEAMYMFTISRMDALAMGAVAAAAIRIPACSGALRGQSSRLAVVALALLILAAVLTHAYNIYNRIAETVGYSILSVAFALIVIVVVLPAMGGVKTVVRTLDWKPLRLIGRYSYAMYIFHYPLHIFFGLPLLRQLNQPVGHPIALLYTLGIIVVSFILAAFSYHFFERYFLRLKSRLPTAPQPA